MAAEEDIDEEDKDVDELRNSVGTKDASQTANKEREEQMAEMKIVGFNEKFRRHVDSNIFYKLFHMTSSKDGSTRGVEQVVTKVRPAEHINIGDKKILYRHYALTENETKLFLKYYNAPVISIHNVHNPGIVHFHWTDDMQIILYHELLDEKGLDHHHLDITKGVISVMLVRDYESWVKKFFELETFPFDYQSLSIDLGTEEGEHFDFSVTSIRFKKLALADNEWAFLEPNIEWHHPFASKVDIMVRRLPLYYIQNVLFTMCILTFLGLSAFSVNTEDCGNRIVVNVTLILTLVAFKFVLAEMLPRTSYNTLLDYYMGLCTITLAVNVAATVLPKVLSEMDVENADHSVLSIDALNQRFFFAMAGWIILFTVGWSVASYLAIRAKDKDHFKLKQINYSELDEDDDMYDIDVSYDDAHKGKEHHHEISKVGILSHRQDPDDSTETAVSGLKAISEQIKTAQTSTGSLGLSTTVNPMAARRTSVKNL